MAEFPDLQDMDAFLINPVKKGTKYAVSQPHNMSGDLIPIFLADEILTVKAGKKVVEPAGIIHNFLDDSIFSQAYASEEEAASPTEDDDFGFHSTSEIESSPSIKESPSIEELSESFNALQLCTKAQAVRFVSAGKAKVVSIPKIVELPSPRSQTRASNESAVVSCRHRVDLRIPPSSNSQDWSSRSSSEGSPGTPSSSSFAEQPLQLRTLRRKPKLPPLQVVPKSASQRSTRAQTPLAEQRAEFSRHDPSLSNWPLGSPVSPSTSKRKMPKLSPTFSLKAFGRPRRSNSTASSSSEEPQSYTEYYRVISSPMYPSVGNNLASTERKAVPKLVARGASERAPPIVLPPCPDDYTDDWDVGYESDWPLRREPVPATPAVETSSTMKHIRRKSVSAAFVTTQV